MCVCVCKERWSWLKDESSNFVIPVSRGPATSLAGLCAVAQASQQWCKTEASYYRISTVEEESCFHFVWVTVSWLPIKAWTLPEMQTTRGAFLGLPKFGVVLSICGVTWHKHWRQPFKLVTVCGHFHVNCDVTDGGTVLNPMQILKRFCIKMCHQWILTETGTQ